MVPKKPLSISVTHGNLAMVGSVLIAAASVVWGASKIDSRVASIEAWIVANKDTQLKLVEAAANDKVLEDNQHKIMQHLDDLDRKIERK